MALASAFMWGGSSTVGLKCPSSIWYFWLGIWIMLTDNKHMQGGAHAPPYSLCTESNLFLFECNRIPIRFPFLLYLLCGV